MKRIVFLFAFLVLASGVQAQEMLPDDLQGDWGEAHQCAAQEDAGADETVSHVTDAPYRFQGQWISRWYIYCLVMQVDPMRGGYRVRALCGEDAIERPWEIDVISDGDTLSMTWFALGEENSASRPWRSGPYERCDAPQS
ncbi:MAG: hypothetical protein AB8B88_01475 [Devosiaceae bacterium]